MLSVLDVPLVGAFLVHLLENVDQSSVDSGVFLQDKAVKVVLILKLALIKEVNTRELLLSAVVVALRRRRELTQHILGQFRRQLVLVAPHQRPQLDSVTSVSGQEADHVKVVVDFCPTVIMELPKIAILTAPTQPAANHLREGGTFNFRACCEVKYHIRK